jgi:DNA-binding NtrC family response regulator
VIIFTSMRGNALRVLVVDDKPAVLMTYTLILQQQGHDVVGATSCQEALCHIESSHAFDVVLCDYTLEDDRNGFHVIDEARRRVPGIRTVLMTGYSEDEVGDAAAQRGVMVLFKPVNVADLLEVVSSASAPKRAIA